MTGEQLARLTPRELEAHFMEAARFMPDAPNTPYFIRVGSRTLFSADTMDLRKQFERKVAGFRLKGTKR